MLIVCIPLFVEIEIAWMDIKTSGIGNVLSGSSTSALLLWELIGLLVTTILVILCVTEQRLLELVYDESYWKD